MRLAALCLPAALSGAHLQAGAQNAGKSAPLRAMITTAQASARPTTSAVPGCPDQSGLLDSITVPVNQPLDLAVVIGAPDPNGAVSFNVSSDAPSIVAAGDRLQGFIPTVTIPAGQTRSNLFTLYGIAVGQTRLRLVPLSLGYATGSYPLGAWDINKSGSGSDQKFLDANAAGRSCRVEGSAALSTLPATQARCGQGVAGVAGDGVSTLLLRSVSGLAGTACFEVVSTGADDGRVRTPLIATAPDSGLNYGLSYFDPPQAFGPTTDASRKATVEFTFTPSIGNGNTSRLRADLEIVRPPLVLVHGVWSNAGAWDESYRRTEPRQFTTVVADYSGTNASAFGVNRDVVRERVTEALDTSRVKGYAATQADVIGHSMGGLLTRNFAASANFLRAENFNKGDVHRLVTLNTPHWGSSFANLLVSLHAVGGATATRVEQTVTELTLGGDMTRGAVCDLAENSPALVQLGGGTSLTAQSITSTGGDPGTPNAPARYWGGVSWFGINSFERALTATYCETYIDRGICIDRRSYFPQDRVNAFRFREANDAVVGLASQRGGLTGANFADPIHFHTPWPFRNGITDNSAATARALALLDGSASALASTLPGVPADGSGVPRTVPGVGSNAADYTTGCVRGGPLSPLLATATRVRAAAPAAVDPRVRIVTPQDQITVLLGSAFDVVVELTPPLTENNTVGVSISGLGRVEAAWTGDGLRFRAALPPLPSIGSYSLTPDLTDTAGRYSVGIPVAVGVAPAAAPVALVLVQKHFQLRPGAAARQLQLQGRQSDGGLVDLTPQLTGTTYASSNASVVTVAADGLVSIVGVGQAQVTARNGALSAAATFVIRDPALPQTPAALTTQFQITRSGLRLDRGTGFYVQQVVLRNVSPTPAVVPLVLTLSGLPAGVTLISRSGLTEQLAPLGRPYVAVRPGGDGLAVAPGASVEYTFQFLNPARAAITYTLDVVGGIAAP